MVSLAHDTSHHLEVIFHLGDGDSMFHLDAVLVLKVLWPVKACSSVA